MTSPFCELTPTESRVLVEACRMLIESGNRAHVEDMITVSKSLAVRQRLRWFWFQPEWWRVLAAAAQILHHAEPDRYPAPTRTLGLWIHLKLSPRRVNTKTMPPPKVRPNLAATE